MDEQPTLPPQVQEALQGDKLKPSQEDVLEEVLEQLRAASNVAVLLPAQAEHVLLSPAVALQSLRAGMLAQPKILVLLSSDQAVKAYGSDAPWLAEQVDLDRIDSGALRTPFEMERLVASADVLATSPQQLMEALGRNVITYPQLAAFGLAIIDESGERGKGVEPEDPAQRLAASLIQRQCRVLYLASVETNDEPRRETWQETLDPHWIEVKQRGQARTARRKARQRRASSRAVPRRDEEGKFLPRRRSRETVPRITTTERLLWIGLIVGLLLFDLQLLSVESMLSRGTFLLTRLLPVVALFVLLRHEILGVLSLFVSILTVISFLSLNHSWLARVWLAWLRQGLGWGAYVVPFALSGVGFALLNHRARYRADGPDRRGLGLLLIFCTSLALTHLGSGAAGDWQAVLEGRAGGLLGWVIGWSLQDAFGRTSAYVVVVALLAMGVLLAVETSLGDLFFPLREAWEIISYRWRMARLDRPPRYATRQIDHRAQPRVPQRPGRVSSEILARRRRDRPDRTADQAEDLAQSHWYTRYALGNGLYDESFSIETDAGEFMGECGISISETIGTVEPDKVTAFEVWLFDKNDVRTVTGVLMSEYEFNDLDLHAHLSDKGTPVLAEVDRTVCLETATLSLDVVITEMVYGTDDECPPSSFFEALAVELIVPSGAADGSPAWAEAQQQAEIIEQTLESLGAPARVVGVHRVPSATWFDVEPGTKVDETGAQIEVEAGQIDALADDLALALVVPSLHIAPAAAVGATVRIGIPRASEPEEDDPRLDEAISLVRDANRASATLLQRRLRIGYARAARLIEAMEAHGIIGPDRGGSRGRKVL